MSIILPLEPGEAFVCRGCSAEMGPGDRFNGPGMWHQMEPTCRHRRFFSCPSCWLLPLPDFVCLECGCESFYT